MAIIKSINYESYTGDIIKVIFKCIQCGSDGVYRHKSQYGLLFLEGHYHCIGCKKEVDYTDDDFMTERLGIIYDFKPFKDPANAIFKIPTDKYDDKPVTKEQEFTIIGETDDQYIYQLKKTEQGEWIGNRVFNQKFVLPIGIHKSRLIRWTTGQLTLAI
jgi:hypothetical protein